MATNFYFRNHDARNEQNLVEDLVVEAIKIYGMDCYYLPRKIENRSDVIDDVKFSTFNHSYGLEFYVKNVEGFQGQGDFLSKFGVEIRDQMVLTVSRRSFKTEVTDNEPALIRPREGDVIWFPLNGKLFEIQHVEHESVFYQMGSLQTYDLTVELFEYSGETFNTGIPDIDAPFRMLEKDLNANGVPSNIEYIESGGEYILGANGTPIVLPIPPDLDQDTGDAQGENFEVQVASNTYIDFTEEDPFSENGRY